MTIRYGNSTLGQAIVIYESADEFSSIRKFFVFETLLAGMAIILLAIQNFSRLSKSKNSTTLVKWVHILFILTAFFHSAHYADHNYRAVYYREPKFVHQKYFLSPMEFSFYLNFITSIIGIFALRNYFSVDKNGYKIIRSSCLKMFAFIIASITTLLHYRNEPPKSYGWDANLTITGDGIVGILFLATNSYCFFNTFANEKNYQKINQDDVHENLRANNDVRHRSPKRVK